MNKKLDDLNNLSASQFRVKMQHSKFDLETFMNHYTSVSDAAVLLLTPSQVVTTNLFVNNNYGDFCVHEDTLREIYNTIYVDFEKPKTQKKTLQDSIMADGNIFMLLMNGPAAINIIGIPDVISVSQYNLLVDFNNKIKEMYENDKSYFDSFPMRFITYYGSDNYNENVNNIDAILVNLKNSIGDAQEREEVILGDSIKDLDVYWNNSNLFFKSKKLKK